MKILKMTATFGKLRQQTLELKEGLNIIEAPNESGKSTWAGFLRAMLYGIDTRERDRKGVLAEKNRYLPWDGGAMEGSMSLLWNGHDITLRRTSKGASPLSQFQAVYTGTEEPVPQLTADNAGELLTGVGREGFERSAFIGQSAVNVTSSAELERRISAIVSSGQEDVSYSETEQQLREWRNRRQSNQKTGLIPRLETERAAVAATLQQLDNANRQAAEARANILSLEAQQAELEQQEQAHRTLAMAQLRNRYNTALTELEQAQKELKRVQHEQEMRGSPPEDAVLRKMQGDLAYLNTLDSNIKQARHELETIPIPSMDIAHPVFRGMDPNYARQRAENDVFAVNTEQKCRKQKLWQSIILFIVAAILLAVSLIMWVLPPALVAILAIVLATLRLADRNRGQKRSADILHLYDVAYSAAILEQAEEYSLHWQAAEEQRTQAAARAVALERMETEREVLCEHLLNSTHIFAPEVTDLFGVSAAVSLALNLSQQEQTALIQVESAEKVLQAITAQGIPDDVPPCDIVPELTPQEIAAQLSRVHYELSRQKETLAMTLGEINTLGDSATLQSQLTSLDDELQRRRAEHSAISLAMDALKQANVTLQSRMSPALNKRAGELFHALTGGRYDQVSLTREFEALAARKDDVTPRNMLYLSKGTVDQLYLAVRLAVCDLVLDGEDPAPLILDDALVHFDDTRLSLALDLLSRLGEHRQILLFTCQGRESTYLEQSPNVHITRLQS